MRLCCAVLCLNFYSRSEAAERRGLAVPLHLHFTPSPRHSPHLTAIVNVPSTLLYHARVVKLQQHDKLQRLRHSVAFVEFVLTCSGEERKWRVDTMGDRYSGHWAVHIGDNVEQPEEKSSVNLTSAAATATVSSKQRYIDLLQCSEHFQRRCRRLLPPRPRAAQEGRFVNAPSTLPPVPLCCSCRSVIARSNARAHNDCSPEDYKRLGCHTY